MNRGSIDKFAKSESIKAGMAKGGWAGSAMALGGIRGIPAWVHKHREWGTALDKTQGMGDRPYVYLSNRINYIDHLIPNSRKADALVEQQANFKKHIQYALANRGRKKL